MRAEAAPASPRSERLLSLDLLRGLVVLLMLFVNQADGVDGAPSLLLHAADDVDAVTLADLVFPAFLFMVGMSIPFALGARLRRGDRWGALRHVLARVAALLVLGVLMANADRQGPRAELPGPWWGALVIVGAFLLWQAPPSAPERRGAWRAARTLGALLLLALVLAYRSPDASGLVQIRPLGWGILGMIGWAYFAAALLYLTLRERPWGHLGFVALLNGLYYLDVLAEPAWMVSLRPVVGLGGLVGSQGAVAVAGLAVGALASRHARAGGSARQLAASTLTVAGALIVAGLLLHLAHARHPSFMFSKPAATPPWGLVSAGITTVAWIAFFVAADGLRIRRWPPLLRITGQNALLTYLLEPIVLALLAASAVVFGRNPWAYLVERGTAAGLLAAVLFACVVGRIAGGLAHAGVRLRL